MNWFSNGRTAFLACGALLGTLAWASDPVTAPLTVDKSIPVQRIQLTLTADRIQKITPADPKTVPANAFMVVHNPRVVLSEKFTFVDDVQVGSLPFGTYEGARDHLCKAFGFSDAFSVVGYDTDGPAAGFRLAPNRKDLGRVYPVNDRDSIVRQVTCLP